MPPAPPRKGAESMDSARRLLHRYLDEIASPDDLAELTGLLPHRPGLADELAEAARFEALLETCLAERRTLTAVAAVLAIWPVTPWRIVN